MTRTERLTTRSDDIKGYAILAGLLILIGCALAGSVIGTKLIYNWLSRPRVQQIQVSCYPLPASVAAYETPTK